MNSKNQATILENSISEVLVNEQPKILKILPQYNVDHLIVLAINNCDIRSLKYLPMAMPKLEFLNLDDNYISESSVQFLKRYSSTLVYLSLKNNDFDYEELNLASLNLIALNLIEPNLGSLQYQKYRNRYFSQIRTLQHLDGLQKDSSHNYHLRSLSKDRLR